VAAVCFAGLVQALWRFIYQRFKATQQAYWFLLTLESKKAEPSARPPRRDGLTHAGAVVYRGKGSARQFLLIQASRDRSEWVLPKGHIEPGEDHRVTAIREVKEESGHWAKYQHYLGDSRIGHGPNALRVRWFLLECVEKPKEWHKENRQFNWLSLDKSIEVARFQEAKDLLEKVREYFEESKAAQDKRQ
jgi:8-oxo-dGTP pyrophosphatase MutT (NUDIX family)